MTEENPLNLLRKSLNKTIIIKLKNGHEFKGKLAEMDSYMNVVLLKAKEIDEDDSVVEQYEKIFIRGNNILFIKPNADE